MPELQHIEQSFIPRTSTEEMEQILQAQQRELAWWNGQQDMTTQDDIDIAIKKGAAVKVPNEGTGYKISANVKEVFRVLEKNTYTLLEEVSQAWINELETTNIQSNKLFLVVSSLARTTKFQEELIQTGYPAAKASTHTKLGAFDIATKWFEQNRPELLQALTRVLEKLSKENKLNYIKEPTVGAYHVAFNRTSIQ